MDNNECPMICGNGGIDRDATAGEAAGRSSRR
ncbi:hypothetical protein PC123_g1939 [Phytophthora cactorum]|nr:hypothetical protein PC120_g1688 [Phytophthora cactorum]KAG4063196.1 hypothetical protein PC123_g1939 [Phytophthora cactorum]